MNIEFGRVRMNETYQSYRELNEYIYNTQVAESILDEIKSDDKNWIRIGKVFSKPDVLNQKNITNEMGRIIKELEWLYRKSTGYTVKGKIKRKQLMMKR